jgi:transposase
LFIRFEDYGKVERKVGSGRKRKTTQRDDNAMERLAKKKRFITRDEIKQELDLNVSKRTISRRLHEKGIIILK